VSASEANEAAKTTLRMMQAFLDERGRLPQTMDEMREWFAKGGLVPAHMWANVRAMEADHEVFARLWMARVKGSPVEAEYAALLSRMAEGFRAGSEFLALAQEWIA
jgi:hypothetical protein